ncbi:hypothetical protein BpHYR1_031025 [Brachionus plicatilis]|uniref:Uncharacterized protein n=1 Tax=Brachionus plicatilis TaxID=10195 RepID=A0A3M7PIW1_BRAPC|nr:hypothetical protein BpHYR1_031025 [Brachionus plicatilis]
MTMSILAKISPQISHGTGLACLLITESVLSSSLSIHNDHIFIKNLNFVQCLVQFVFELHNTSNMSGINIIIGHCLPLAIAPVLQIQLNNLIQLGAVRIGDQFFEQIETRFVNGRDHARQTNAAQNGHEPFGVGELNFDKLVALTGDGKFVAIVRVNRVGRLLQKLHDLAVRLFAAFARLVQRCLALLVPQIGIGAVL